MIWPPLDRCVVGWVKRSADPTHRTGGKAVGSSLPLDPTYGTIIGSRMTLHPFAICVTCALWPLRTKTR